MERSPLLAGAGVAVLGLALAGFGLRDGGPALGPLAVSGALVVTGAAVAVGGVLDAAGVRRALAGAATGAVAVGLVGLWAASRFAGGDEDVALVVATCAGVGALLGLAAGAVESRGERRRRRLLDEQARAEQSIRINATLRQIHSALVRADDRDELEAAVVEGLAESEPYDAAWIGRYDPLAERVEPAAWSGREDEYFEGIEVRTDDSDLGRGPGGRVIKTREPQFVDDVFAEPSLEPWYDEFERFEVVALAAIPVLDDDDIHGFISVYASRPDLFDERERAMLTELGRTLGRAIQRNELRDQLERRERELDRQNRRLEEFASAVSHDLRNPLNVALGNAERVRNGETEAIEPVEDALRRMETLVGDLLTLARQGQAVGETERASLSTLAEDAWATVDTGEATLDTEAVGTIECDVSRVRQLLENLFRNAIDHAGADATVTVGSLDDGFYVADDGPGLPEETDVFERGVSTAGGTGFGLSIVRGIAEAHGWTVTATESASGGARFEFRGVEV